MDETPYFFNKNPLQNFTPNELNTVSLLQEIIYQHYLCTSSAQEMYIFKFLKCIYIPFLGFVQTLGEHKSISEADRSITEY